MNQPPNSLSPAERPAAAPPSGRGRSPFQRATKRGAKLRAAIFGPSGSGKTFTSLRIATGLGRRLALIDSERGSASKYADRFEFDVANLTDLTVNGYQEAIVAAGRAGYDVLIIDSLTHAWRELLDELDSNTNKSKSHNKWAGWAKITPKHHRFIDCILNYPGHVIATMRSKTAWDVSNDGGRVKPVRVGVTPDQRDGVEYEFDLLLELSTEHVGEVIKDRTGKFQDRIIEKPGEEFGEALAAWLADAPMPELPPPQSSQPEKKNVTTY